VTTVESDSRLASPLFLVGMGRSGTTVIFESVAAHPAVGWFNYHLERLPRWPWLATAARPCDLSHAFRKSVNPSSRRRPWLERLRDGPSEAYSVWATCCGEKFRHDYLLDVEPTAEERRRARELVAQVLRYQGKRRFVAKLTGPARMGYLLGIFPDARFVHVVRDGRAVVESLMRVDFWKDSYRMYEPAWRGGLTQEDRETLAQAGGGPLALAAVQWRAVIERTREEARRHHPQRYLEIRYEDYLRDPLGMLARVFEQADLSPSDQVRHFVENRLRPAATPERFPEAFDGAQLAMLEDIMGPLLGEFGYTQRSA